MDQNKLNKLIQHQAYLYRLSSSEVVQLLQQFDQLSNTMLSKLRDCLDELSDAERTTLMAGQYTTPQLKTIRSLLQDWQRTLGTQLTDQFMLSAMALAFYEANYIAKQADQMIKANEKTLIALVKKKPMIGGVLLDALFSKIAGDSRLKVESLIRDALNQGQTNQQILQRIKGTKRLSYQDGILNQSRITIDMMTRTARSHVANVTYVDTYEKLGAKYLRFVSVLDSRTSLICGSLDGTVWAINDPEIRRPPLHPHCRSILVGVEASGDTLGQRPAKNNQETKTVNSNTSFKEWFAQQDQTFQKNWLGTSRFELYQQGKYSLDKFVDPLSGQPFTLKQMQAIH